MNNKYPPSKKKMGVLFSAVGRKKPGRPSEAPYRSLPKASRPKSGASTFVVYSNLAQTAPPRHTHPAEATADASTQRPHCPTRVLRPPSGRRRPWPGHATIRRTGRSNPPTPDRRTHEVHASAVVAAPWQNLTHKSTNCFGPQLLLISTINVLFGLSRKNLKLEKKNFKNLRGARRRAAAARRCKSLCQDARPQRKPANMGPWSL